MFIYKKVIAGKMDMLLRLPLLFAVAAICVYAEESVTHFDVKPNGQHTNHRAKLVGAGQELYICVVQMHICSVESVLSSILRQHNG